MTTTLHEVEEHLARLAAGQQLRHTMGILSALIWVSLVGAGWVTGLAGDSAPALFAVSIAFGLAQEPVRRLLEGKLAQKGGDASGSSTA